MRDPLGRVPIKYKLTLAFLMIAGMSLGMGGVIGYSRFSETLVERIEGDLAREAEYRSDSVAGRVQACRDQVADFASDGLIRDLSSVLARQPERPEAAARLEEHLRAHKLDRIRGLDEILVLDPDGVPVARAAAPNRGHEILSLSAALPEGLLVVGLGPEAIGAALEGEPGPRSVRLVDAQDRLLFAATSPIAPGEPVLSARRRVPGLGWEVVVDVSEADALAPVLALRRQLLQVGVGLGLFTAILLYFPLRYTVWPLTRLAESARRTLAEGRPVEVQVDGADEIGELAAALHHMASGLLERSRDVTREKDRLRAVLDCMKEGIVFVDESGTIALANSATDLARHQAGWSGGAAGTGTRDPIAARLESLVGRARAGGGTIDDGEWEYGGRVYECAATPVRDSSQARLGVVCVHRDVTERRRTERRATRAETLAGIGRLAAGIAHELGTPLGSIVFFCDEVAEELKGGRCGECVGSSELMEMLVTIQRQAYRCKEIGRRLLDLSREDPTRLRPTDLEPLLEEAVSIVAASREDPPEFTIRVLPGAATLATDREKLLGALTAILENAADAGRKVEVTGRAAVDAGEAGGAQAPRITSVQIEIADDGPGIPVSEVGRVFEPFYTTKAPGWGRGLGLPLAYSKIRALGGEIDIEAAPGAGTTMRITLPIRSGSAVSQAARTS